MQSKTAAHDKVVEVFDGQARFLIEAGYDRLASDPHGFLSGLSRLGKFVRDDSAVRTTSIHDGCYSCLIIIPASIISLRTQVSQVVAGVNGEKGAWDRFILELYDPKDWMPAEPYVVLDIEPGAQLSGDVDFARNSLNRHDRRGLVLEEGISLLTHFPGALDERGLYFVESKPDPRGKIPSAKLYGGAWFFNSLGVRDSSFGIPSVPKIYPNCPSPK